MLRGVSKLLTRADAQRTRCRRGCFHGAAARSMHLAPMNAPLGHYRARARSPIILVVLFSGLLPHYRVNHSWRNDADAASFCGPCRIPGLAKPGGNISEQCLFPECASRKLRMRGPAALGLLRE